MNVYFIILLCLEVLRIGINLAKHGEPKEGDYSFFYATISAGINIFLLYMAVKQGF